MSETPNGLYPALLAAQQAMGPVKKDANNPAFRTKYATLLSVLETVEGPLADNGLVLLQRFDVGEGGPVLITEIVHAASGQSITSALPIVSKDPTDPQKLGGAITYARRYSLLALLGLAPEDDDGNAAAQPPPRQNRPTPAQRPAAPRNAPRRPDDSLVPHEWRDNLDFDSDNPNAHRPKGQAILTAPAVRPAADEHPEWGWNEAWGWLRREGIHDQQGIVRALGGTYTGWTPGEIVTAIENKQEA